MNEKQWKALLRHHLARLIYWVGATSRGWLVVEFGTLVFGDVVGLVGDLVTVVELGEASVVDVARFHGRGRSWRGCLGRCVLMLVRRLAVEGCTRTLEALFDGALDAAVPLLQAVGG